jgi:hypothetical protein
MSLTINSGSIIQESFKQLKIIAQLFNNTQAKDAKYLTEEWDAIMKKGKSQQDL